MINNLNKRIYNYLCKKYCEVLAGVASWAHNPKVGGSNPSLATNKNSEIMANRGNRTRQIGDKIIVIKTNNDNPISTIEKPIIEEKSIEKEKTFLLTFRDKDGKREERYFVGTKKDAKSKTMPLFELSSVDEVEELCGFIEYI